MGIFNVGGAGVVRVGGEDYRLGYKEALYLGMGDREVLFESIDPAAPAKFYFNSVCAHCNYPDRKITKEDAVVAHMGSLEGSNERDINKMIVSQVLPTCRLQMGMTELARAACGTPCRHISIRAVWRRTSISSFRMIRPCAT